MDLKKIQKLKKMSFGIYPPPWTMSIKKEGYIETWDGNWIYGTGQLKKNSFDRLFMGVWGNKSDFDLQNSEHMDLCSIKFICELRNNFDDILNKLNDLLQYKELFNLNYGPYELNKINHLMRSIYPAPWVPDLDDEYHFNGTIFCGEDKLRWRIKKVDIFTLKDKNFDEPEDIQLNKKESLISFFCAKFAEIAINSSNIILNILENFYLLEQAKKRCTK